METKAVTAVTKEGRTLVVDEQMVRVKQVFKDDLISIPREEIIGVVVTPVGRLTGVLLTFYMRSNQPYEVQIINPKHAQRVAELFQIFPTPPLQQQVVPQQVQVISQSGVEEQQPQVVIVQQQVPAQPRTETKVITYKDAKAMEKGMQKEAKDGWIAQHSINTGGKVSVPKMVLLGPLLGGARSKEHFTITFVRQVQG